MKPTFLLEILAALSIFASSSTGAFAQVEYSITELGSINTSDALSINANGQVAATQNAISIISPLGKYINDSGQALQGTSLLYGGGTLTPVVGIEGGASINDSGQVVGTLPEPEGAGGDGFNHAVIYNGFTITDLGDGSAIAINNGGQVVGFTSVLRGGIPSQAFLYSGGTMNVLTGFGGAQSWATAINNNGQVVGCYDTANFYHAFLYSGGMIDLGTLSGTISSEAHGINDSGQIVGYCFNNANGSGGDAAFIYNNGKMADLNSLIPANSDWNLENAEGINDGGQIVGYGTDPSGQTDAFLLTPTPEPSTIALSVAGVAFLIVFRRIVRRQTGFQSKCAP